jgi:hypothetical protein
LSKLLSKDFKERCRSYIPKAQSTHILKHSVANALQRHMVSFTFDNAAGDIMYMCETKKPFEGITTEITFFDDLPEFKGKAITKFVAPIVIRNPSMHDEDIATFYVR